ncbi:MAG: hypothetical protein ACI9DC_001124 [Gammaproteobacteria bacterium]|jgi:hypothetical protein
MLTARRSRSCEHERHCLIDTDGARRITKVGRDAQRCTHEYETFDLIMDSLKIMTRILGADAEPIADSPASAAPASAGLIQ